MCIHYSIMSYYSTLIVLLHVLMYVLRFQLIKMTSVSAYALSNVSYEWYGSYQNDTVEKSSIIVCTHLQCTCGMCYSVVHEKVARLTISNHNVYYVLLHVHVHVSSYILASLERTRSTMYMYTYKYCKKMLSFMALKRKQFYYCTCIMYTN